MMEALGYLATALMGLSLGLLGGGGSILTVPILVYFFKLDGIAAATQSLFIVGTTALLGGILSARRGLVDFRTGLVFVPPSFAGVFLARKIVLPFLPDSFHWPTGLIISKSLVILIGFAVLMILSSRAMIRSGQGKREVETTPHGPAAIGLKGFLVGLVTGFVGAGGGFLIIPALVLLLHLSMRRAVGTSLTIIAVNSLFGFAVSLPDESIEWNRLLWMTALGTGGLLLGSLYSPGIDEKKLKQGFGYFVLVAGLFVLIDQSLKITMNHGH